MIAPLFLAAVFGFTPTTAHRVDTIVASALRVHRAPGVAIGIVESGRLVYARGYGSANLSRRIPAAPGTQFAIGQISEQFTAAAILLLAQDGKLTLDDTVTTYLPKLRIARYVTIRDLLDQTSGLGTVRSYSNLIAAADLVHPIASPGTVYAPNPLNYLIAGRIVEHVSGVPLSDYIEQHVFLPLVMDSSLYAGDNGLSPEHADGYTVEHGRFERATPWSAQRLGGDAGVFSNVYDLAKWDIEFPLLLRVDAEREMFTPGLTGGYQRHAMGWTIDQRSGHRFYWQNGEVPGFHAMNALLPDEHVAVIVLANVDSFNEPAAFPEGLAGRILDVVVPPSPQHVDNAILMRAREWTGRLASGRIDRTQLTPSFSRYLSDATVREMGIASLGHVHSVVPVASMSGSRGETTYEFLVLFARGERHMRLTMTPDNRIDFISVTP